TLPGVLHTVFRSKNAEVIDSGCRCVATLIRLSADRLLKWQNDENSTTNGGMIPDILKMIEKILHPSLACGDSGILKIGTLLNELILKLGKHLNEKILTQLLVLVIQRLHMAYLTELKQHLLIVLLRLVLLYDKNVITFLSKHNNGYLTVPVFDKKSLLSTNRSEEKEKENVSQQQYTQIATLSFVMNAWCEHHPVLMYPYYIKISLAAMCKLLQIKVECLYDITTNGYQLDMENTRRTRSQGAGYKEGKTVDSTDTGGEKIPFSKMPLLAKFLQLIVHTAMDDTVSQDPFGDPKDLAEDEYEDDEDEWDEFNDVEDDVGSTGPSSMANKSHQSRDSRKPNKNSDHNKENDDDDEEWMPTREDFQTYKKDAIDNMDAMLYGSTPYNQEITECPEALDDPLYQINVQSHITTFLQGFAANDSQTFNKLVKELNTIDQTHLKKMLQQ
ncbi:hypothetical protein RFI_01126, partial [Reticulomyxa filosa]